MAKTQKAAGKASARKTRTLTVKKETIKDLAAPKRGRDVKGGTVYVFYSAVKGGGLVTAPYSRVSSSLPPDTAYWVSGG